MIPYFQWTDIPLGPLSVKVWGLFVALGILTAAIVGRREARRRGLDGEAFVELVVWVISGAIVGARLGFAVFYDSAPFLNDPLAIFRLWEGGMSSLGGLIGAFVAAIPWARVTKRPFAAYADVGAFVLPLGYGIGRLGCFFIHDHPGIRSQLFFAVAYPGGGRLDHGLIISIFSFTLFGIFFWLHRRPKSWDGKYLPLFLLAYGSARFGLDFFRAWDGTLVDRRWLYLTPAQYGGLVMVAVGIWLWQRRPSVLPPPKT